MTTQLKQFKEGLKTAVDKLSSAEQEVIKLKRENAALEDDKSKGTLSDRSSVSSVVGVYDIGN